VEPSTEGDGGRGVGWGEGGVSRRSSRTPSERGEGAIRTEGRTVVKEMNEQGGLVCMRERESEREREGVRESQRMCFCVGGNDIDRERETDKTREK